VRLFFFSLPMSCGARGLLVSLYSLFFSSDPRPRPTPLPLFPPGTTRRPSQATTFFPNLLVFFSPRGPRSAESCPFSPCSLVWLTTSPAPPTFEHRTPAFFATLPASTANCRWDLYAFSPSFPFFSPYASTLLNVDKTLRKRLSHPVLAISFSPDLFSTYPVLWHNSSCLMSSTLTHPPLLPKSPIALCSTTGNRILFSTRDPFY